MGCGSAADLLLGAGGVGQEEWSRRRVGQREVGWWNTLGLWQRWQGSWVLLSAGGIESPPLVIKNGGFVLPLSPSPRHQAQLVNALPQAGVECLLEVVDQSNIS